MKEPKAYAELMMAFRDWASRKGAANVQADLSRAHVRYLLHLYDTARQRLDAAERMLKEQQ